LSDGYFAERLSHVQKGNDHAYYTYDGSGQRVRKVVVKGGITEERLYLGGFEIFRKRVGNDLDFERATLHVMDDKKRIALVEVKTVENGVVVASPSTVVRYQLDNHLGSASLELDETAAVVSYEEYYPYGDTSYQAGRSASEVSQKRYRYTGKEKDEESGLYYHGARYYACWLGRWTAADPIGVGDGVNLYMYVRGNPVRLHDPSGNGSEEERISRSSSSKSGTSSGSSSSSSASSSSSSASSATNSRSSSTATPSKAASKPEWRQRELGFRERLDMEGGPISFLFKIGYDITDELFLSGQRAKNTILRSDNDEFRLNGDFATNTEVQDALVNVMLLGIPEAKGLTSTGKAVEKGVATETKGMPLPIGGEPIDDMAKSLNESLMKLVVTKPKVEIDPSKGFKTFAELKKSLGSAGKGMEWHHIVEQSQIKATRSGFAPELIQNPDNVVALDKTTHGLISKYYSSKQPFTHGQTVRDWLNGKSIQEQFDFGMDILNKYGAHP